MINFNLINIGGTFVTSEGLMVLTGKNLDEQGNLVGVSYQPASITLSE